MNPSDWSSTCEKILSTKHAPLCQQILKKGLTPTPLRGQIWSIVLGSEIEDHVSQFSYFTLQLLKVFFSAH